MTDYGVTPTGFVRKPYEVIVDEMRTDLRARWGTQVNLESDSMLGQLVDTIAVKMSEEWEVAEAAYASQDPDQAEDASLDAVSAITGTSREPATRTHVKGTVNVNPGTYPAGSLIASVTGKPTERFETIADVVNATAGALDVGVNFRALDTGPLLVYGGTLIVMASAVAGWNSVTNISDQYLRGTDIEKDPELRDRREQELASLGSTNVDAIRADLLKIRNADGSYPVLRATVLENVTDTTDGNGLLPHSIEAIVYAPAANDAQIAAALFGTKGSGPNTNGTTTVAVKDAQGFEHAIKFTRPTILDAYASVEIEVDAAIYAGNDAVKDILAAADDEFGPGDPLLWSKLICQPYEVSGVTKVVTFGLALSGGGPFTLTDITPTLRQVVRLTTANVTVEVV